MAEVRAFIAFDFDHDEDLRNLLVGQAKHPESPFEIADWSVKERIKRVDQVIVICGEYTHSATGVGTELSIAQEEKKPYFLLSGRKDKVCTKPTTAKTSDKIYTWSWDNLKSLIAGARCHLALKGKTPAGRVHELARSPQPVRILT